MLINKKAQFPSTFNKLQSELHLSIDFLQKVFMLPHKVALEPYVKAFQYKILNSILYTNTKLYKIGFSLCNKCTFCQSDLKTLHHLLYSCPPSKTFWNEFEQYWFSITKERICLTKKDIIVGIITRSCPLLNYLLISAKLYLWDCRRNQTLPRPISVIPVVAKVFERIIYDQLYHYLTTNNFLSCHQSGFRSLHSTLTALFEATSDSWAMDIDRGLVNAVVFLDLKKAFDKVDHDILLRKLQYCGICWTSHQWFASYLDNRTQICHLNSCM